MGKNYFDEHGNYMNVENLTLAEIYKSGYQDGIKVAVKNIMACGDCNTCGISKTCQYKPNWGQMVRFNCPHYQKRGEKNDK